MNRLLACPNGIVGQLCLSFYQPSFINQEAGTDFDRAWLTPTFIELRLVRPRSGLPSPASLYGKILIGHVLDLILLDRVKLSSVLRFLDDGKVMDRDVELVNLAWESAWYAS